MPDQPDDTHGGNEPQPELWERGNGEPSRAYEGFCAYRDAGPSRQMDRLWRAFTVSQGRVVSERARCSSTWWDWYRRYDWRKRAEAYDAMLELRRRRTFERQHNEKIDAHLERQRAFSAVCTSVSLRMLQIAQKALNTVVADGEPGAHTLDPKRLPQYVGVAAKIAAMGNESEASALAIDELMGVLDESQS